MKNDYDAIAQFYDAFVGDPAEKAAWLKQLVQKYQPNAKSVLELACGTGGVLKHLSDDYVVAGLDNSAGMLRIAQSKLPNATFIEADMSNFSISDKYDIILCVYDSINHLTDFSQWESTFDAAARSLHPDGLFIFDMNTVTYLEKINHSEPSISSFEGGTLKINARPGKDTLSVLELEVIEKKTDGNEEVYTSEIPETSFDLSRVEVTLSKHFEIVDQFDERAYKKDSYDGKVFFVCRLAKQ
jgi:ubiquinone/menaquinone biosynthesis C-methylase UbiE